MRTKAETDSEEAEKRVRDTWRATRRQYSAEEKIRMDVSRVCAARRALRSYAARKT
jgi:hypothetical protein